MTSFTYILKTLTSVYNGPAFLPLFSSTCSHLFVVYAVSTVILIFPVCLSWIPSPFRIPFSSSCSLIWMSQKSPCMTLFHCSFYSSNQGKVPNFTDLMKNEIPLGTILILQHLKGPLMISHTSWNFLSFREGSDLLARKTWTFILKLLYLPGKKKSSGL